MITTKKNQEKTSVGKCKFGRIEVGEACIYTTEEGDDLIIRAIMPTVIKGSCRVANAFIENTAFLTYVDPETLVLLCNLSIEANVFDPKSVDNDTLLRKKFGLLRLGELCYIDGDERAFVKTSENAACPIFDNLPDFYHPCSIDEDYNVYVVQLR